MSAELGPLFHWSPRTRLSGIKRLGLMPSKRNITGPVYHDDDDRSIGEFRQSMVCFGTSPASAWTLSHDIFRVPGTYDLWETYLIPTDEVHVLPMWGGRLSEIRVNNRIPKSRLIWVGERTITP